ncbi:DNA mismatch repair protein MutS [Salipiger aestuarii]|uniref:DNA-nicking Smr family endonuclease n=1 Tax=Salipiger aestuarii TaxID=568098 RepID=A0A327YLP3_9RHOB|nr:Smr/MutS family protein [Salipiger aestuarii]EIE52613.1 Smr protein/MutS2 [Citreicella sp. 357]KAA8609847.1 DNA mismatch repair protein MutS [Salipiger aestuarii]KAA8616159.1 DNA mismatch repair protein MutS [Salipiger aestuarii]KAB2543107.1 DNA mismatch repair protein MutS [Salipiger aestuarii]RAK21421.1 DNA-nicking Smr family endonuclease [Salipiger aestuarii]
MSRRRIRPDELELWNLVARSADRLPGRVRRKDETPKPPAPELKGKATPAPLPDFSLGDRAGKVPEHHDFRGTTSDRLRSAPLNMDARAFKTMKRGKLAPEARLDLHGMTLDQAHPELVRFILTSQTRALRLVLVITGKGLREDPHDPMPRRRGVLKTQVPQWLRLPPVAQAVLQVSEAHNRHGGGGAYYVYLRKRR